MGENYLTLTQVAKLVGVRYHRLYEAHRRGVLAEPVIVGGRTRLYSPEDVERVREYFAKLEKEAAK